MVHQTDLFGSRSEPAMPEGFRYQPDLISADEELGLVEIFHDLPFREFEFHGYLGKRRVVPYGWKYDFEREQVARVDDIPEFLHPLRAKVAEFAGLGPGSLQQALVTEYGPGAGIGWHRDKGMFGDVLGVSLVSTCVFRLRRKVGARWPAGIEETPAALCLLDARLLANRMGAQHPARRSAPVFGHVSEFSGGFYWLAVPLPILIPSPLSGSLSP